MLRQDAYESWVTGLIYDVDGIMEAFYPEGAPIGSGSEFGSDIGGGSIGDGSDAPIVYTPPDFTGAAIGEDGRMPVARRVMFTLSVLSNAWSAEPVVVVGTCFGRDVTESVDLTGFESGGNIQTLQAFDFIESIAIPRQPLQGGMMQIGAGDVVFNPNQRPRAIKPASTANYQFLDANGNYAQLPMTAGVVETISPREVLLPAAALTAYF